MAVQIPIPITVSLILWRVFGTITTLVVAKILASYLFSTVPKIATAAEYDLLNRIGGSDSFAWSLWNYLTITEPAKRLTLPAILRVSILLLPLVTPFILSLLFDFGLSDFSACNILSVETLPPTYEQLRAGGFCELPLGCDPLLPTRGKIVSCANIVNLSLSDAWYPVCADSPFPIYSPAPTNATGMWGSNGGLEIVPSAVVYNGLVSNIYNPGNLTSGNSTFKRVFAVLPNSDIKSGVVQRGVAWFHNSPGIADTVVGVPVDKRNWTTEAIRRTVYRSTVGCAWTGLSKLSYGQFASLRLIKAWNETAMNYSGPPEFQSILFNTTLILRNDFLSVQNWTYYPERNRFQVDNDGNLTRTLFATSPVLAPVILTDRFVIPNGTSSFTSTATAWCSGEERLNDDYMSRLCADIVLRRTESVVGIIDRPVQMTSEYQYVCAFRLSVGLQDGVLSQTANVASWQLQSTIPTNATITNYFAVSVLRNSSNPTSQSSWIIDYSQRFFELTPAKDATNITDYSTTLFGDYTVDLKFVPAASYWHGLMIQHGLFLRADELQLYFPPASNFLDHVVVRALTRFDNFIYGDTVAEDQVRWFANQSNATDALVTIFTESIASVFAQSVAIAPWRQDLLALTVKVESSGSATCWKPQVGLAALLLVVLSLIVFLLSLLISAKVDLGDIVGLTPYMDALAARFRPGGAAPRAASLWSWLDQHGTVVLGLKSPSGKTFSLGVAPPPTVVHPVPGVAHEAVDHLKYP